MCIVWKAATTLCCHVPDNKYNIIIITFCLLWFEFSDCMYIQPMMIRDRISIGNVFSLSLTKPLVGLIFFVLCVYCCSKFFTYVVNLLSTLLFFYVKELSFLHLKNLYKTVKKTNTKGFNKNIYAGRIVFKP